MTTNSTPKVSRGLRGLRNSFSDNGETVEAERNALLSEIAHLEQWWSDERWNGTKRTYSGEFDDAGAVYSFIRGHSRR